MVRYESFRQPNQPAADAAGTDGYRAVVCYHCRAALNVPASAHTATCPKCYKRLVLNDVIIEDERMGGRVESCGIVFIKRQGRVSAPTVQAYEAVEVLGTLHANVSTPGHVIIGKKAEWKGDCTAKLLVIEDGARIKGGFFRINAEKMIDEEQDRAVEERAQGAA